MYKHESCPITGTVVETTGYNGEKCINTFKCTTCGCSIYYRHKIDYDDGFYAGRFVCRNCKQEFSYADDAFTAEYISPPKQLSLFE